MISIDLQTKIVKKIEDGSHTGTIKRIEDKKVKAEDETYDYVDIVLELDGFSDMELKDGSSAKVSVDEKGKPLSKLAINLTNLGVELMDDDGQPKALDTDMLNTMLQGKPIICMTITKNTGKGNFTNIVDESLKSR